MTATTNPTPPAAWVPDGTPGSVAVPPTVHVACPLVPGKLRRLERCAGCEHFAGLGDRFGEGSGQPFAVRYLLKCRHPRHLPLTEIEEPAA